MLVDTPSARVVAEVGEHHLWGLEGPIAVVERDPDAGVAEADDVRPAVARQIGQEARMALDTPPAGGVAEVANTI